LLAGQAAHGAPKVSILTYHGDNARSGWNDAETLLTPQTLSGGTFGLLHSVTLDEQVDAQPLIVPAVTLAHQGRHDIAYVATENNTVYAIDANSGDILLSRNFGPPVPASAIPGGCDKNSGVIGIDSTPAIDAKAGLLYVITYSEQSHAPTYQLHALALATLADAVAPLVITAAAAEANGRTYRFNAAASRQRPALLLARGTLYAGFGSFCDHDRHASRGWLLGWTAGTLAPLANSFLVNRRAKTPNNYFLTSIWMSGDGPAADASGNIYVVTANADNSGNTYNSKTNPAESVLKLSPDLATIGDFFTPGGAKYGEPVLDMHDRDFGAGGITLLPPQSGSIPNLAVAAGKVGNMYVLDQAELGGYVPKGQDRVVATVPIGKCWCAQSYFTDPDGIGRVVSSGGSRLIVWQVQTSPTTTLTEESTSAPLPTGPDEGVFTSVSSNRTKAGTAIIWAVARPNRSGPPTLTLLAYNAATSATLFSAPAGIWSSGQANANIVPTVANGHVYVAGYKSLDIFGLGER
jgi:hypothetical protein